MYTIFLIIQIFIGLALVVLVLMQQGKGADAGAAFGSGASATVFGARGSANFLSRSSAVLATLFIVNSLLLSTPLIMGRDDQTASVTERAPTPPATESAVPEDLPPAETGAESDAPARPASEDLPPPTAGEQ